MSIMWKEDARTPVLVRQDAV